MRVLPLLSLLVLPTAVSAQVTTGSFEPFGSSCVEGGGTACFSANPKGGNVNAQNLLNEYAYPFSTTKTLLMTGFEFHTRSVSGVKTVPTGLYKAASTGLPEASPTVTGRMTVGPTDAFYRTNFAKPMILKPGNYFIAAWCVEARGPSLGKVTAVYASNLTSGNQVTGIYWRRTNPTWALTGIVTTPSYKIICGGGLGSTLSSTNVPEIGRPFTMYMGTKAATPAVYIFGTSNQNWGTLNLPLGLAPIASGCWVFVSIDLLLPKVTNSQGVATITLPIPNQKSIIGSSFHNQFMYRDAKANTLGWLFSHGVTGTIGGIR